MDWEALGPGRRHPRRAHGHGRPGRDRRPVGRRRAARRHAGGGGRVGDHRLQRTGAHHTWWGSGPSSSALRRWWWWARWPALDLAGRRRGPRRGDVVVTRARGQAGPPPRPSRRPGPGWSRSRWSSSTARRRGRRPPPGRRRGPRPTDWVAFTSANAVHRCRARCCATPRLRAGARLAAVARPRATPWPPTTWWPTWCRGGHRRRPGGRGAGHRIRRPGRPGRTGAVPLGGRGRSRRSRGAGGPRLGGRRGGRLPHPPRPRPRRRSWPTSWPGPRPSPSPRPPRSRPTWPCATRRAGRCRCPGGGLHRAGHRTGRPGSRLRSTICRALTKRASFISLSLRCSWRLVISMR